MRGERNNEASRVISIDGLIKLLSWCCPSTDPAHRNVPRAKTAIIQSDYLHLPKGLLLSSIYGKA